MGGTNRTRYGAEADISGASATTTSAASSTPGSSASSAAAGRNTRYRASDLLRHEVEQVLSSNE
jgi:hypothetical protein